MTGIALAARAKLNLRLRVKGRRPDGHHEVKTLMQSISLHDLVIAERSQSTELTCRGHQVPEGGDNLVLRAHAVLEESAGRRLPTRIRLIKRIPPGSGMGGGSSDAAAVLVAVSRLHGLMTELEPLAAGLGADVPFFLLGGAAEARGRGELLRSVATAPAWFAIAWPGHPVSTAEVYAAWDTLGGEGSNHLLRAAVRVEPRLAEFREALGAGWRMTGSGSAFFRECPGRPEAAAAVAGLECWTAVARTVAS